MKKVSISGNTIAFVDHEYLEVDGYYVIAPNTFRTIATAFCKTDPETCKKIIGATLP